MYWTTQLNQSAWICVMYDCESSAILAAAICWVVGVRGELAMVLKAT